MNLEKLNPWNWFRKEEEQPRHNGGNSNSPVPVQQQSQSGLSSYPLMPLHQEIDRVFDNFLRGFGSALPRDDFFGRGLSLIKPQVDIAENSKNYTIRVEIPGVEKEDIHLLVEDDTLIISGEKRQEKQEDGGSYHRIERSYGSFRRLISLPADADSEHIQADFRQGVLTVTLPRLAQVNTSATRQIPVN
ncbi:MAG TPA: Hsp20/alpha crystallin family protein [Candidatus Methylacidiphilales bacterium]|nr:Hsp20/alpha crystallin family protein [Candidatus Methylacidiphilales bacterium]